MPGQHHDAVPSKKKTSQIQDLPPRDTGDDADEGVTGGALIQPSEIIPCVQPQDTALSKVTQIRRS